MREALTFLTVKMFEHHLLAPDLDAFGNAVECHVSSSMTIACTICRLRTHALGHLMDK